MAFRIGDASGNSVRNKSTDAVVDAVDVGTTNSTGRVMIYTGSQPATPETAASGTLLVTINFGNPAFTSASAGTAGLANGTAIAGTVANTGTAGWYRVIDRDNRPIFDGSVGTSGQDMNFDNVSFVAGGTATITTMSISSPM